MTAIVAVVDSAGPVLALRVTGDPDALLRQFKSCNPRVAGLALSLWCDNEVVARRIGQAAREILERAGHGREGSWLGCTVSQLDAVLRRVASEMGARLLSDDERLRAAVEGLR